MRQPALVELPLLIVSGTLSFAPLTALADDSQAIYENRCGGCHGGSAQILARDKLAILENKIVTRERQQELRDFLKRHGRSTSVQADGIYTLLLGYAMAASIKKR